MSYTTRCPACGTTFKVVPDQLKISDGWVRCGYCSDVFDATLSLQSWAQEPQTPASAPVVAVAEPEPLREPVPEPEVEPVPVPDAPPALPATPPPAPTAVPPQAALPPPPLPTPAIAPPLVPAWAVEEVSAGMPTPTEEEPMASGWEDSDFMAELQRYARQSRPAELEPEVPPSASPAEPAPPPEDDRHEVSPTEAVPAPLVPKMSPPAHSSPASPRWMPEADPPADASMEPGFVRQARRRAFWSSASVRVVLSCLTVLLSAALLAQWGIHERDQVAARWPALRPMLAGACQSLGCTVSPLRQIDDVVIDSSALVRKLGNFYAFDLVLKNQAQVPVAAPALELSLTDLNDQVISRRVFLPGEMPGIPAELPARGSLSTSLRLSINLGNETPMSGYRALLFYP